MNLLKNYCEQIEIYSIDEAFVSISRPNDENIDCDPDADSVNCPIIEITVGTLNDTPIINCPNVDCEVSLSDIMVIYEDCSESEQSNNDQCNNSVGLSVNQLRLGYDDIDNDLCSIEHLWYDTDCNDLEDSSLFNFGIAVDVNSCVDNIENKGIWKYKMGNDEFFTAFDLDGNCNFKLLDKNDEIKFYPNDNYYTTENIETLPQIKFYAWDQTFQSNDDCISSLDNRDVCVDQTSFSENYITANLEIIAINDTPQSEEIVNVTYDEFCQIDDNENCGEENKEMCYYPT